jgi:hypothetical protein
LVVDFREPLATLEDLTVWLGEDPPPGAARLLRTASVIVHNLVAGARYRVDQDGRPEDQKIRDALKWAACSQVEFWLETGDPLGASERFASVHAGSVGWSLAEAVRATDSKTRLSPDVLEILRAAGLASTYIRVR